MCYLGVIPPGTFRERSGTYADGNRWDHGDATVMFKFLPFDLDEPEMLWPLITFFGILTEDARNTAVVGV